MLQYKLTENRFETLVENIPGITYQCALDENWTMEYISHGVEKITGYSVSDFLGNKVRSFASIIHPEDIGKVEKEVSLAVKKKVPYTVEYRIIDSAGASHWVYEKGQATYEANGKAIWLDGVIFDITLRKTLEQVESCSLLVLENLASGATLYEVLDVLARSIEKIFPEMICSVLLLDEDGVHLRHGAAPSLPEFYNDAIEGLAIGKNVGSCGTAAYTRKPCIVDNVRTHPNWLPFIELTSKAGLHACWSHPILSSDGNVLGTFACYYKVARKPTESELDIIRKVTNLVGVAIQRKNEESALIKAKEEAEEANKAKSEFLSRMSHELRTPLNAIMGFSQVLEMDDTLTQLQKEHSLEIYNAGEHLLHLINDILDLSKIEAGKLEITKEKVNITKLLDDCYNLLTPFADLHSSNLVIDFDSQGEVFVSADTLRLKQVLLNILSNAIKYNRENGTVNVTISFPFDGCVRISVSDEGQGLDDNQISRLYNPFDRLGADNTKVEGVGIGLVISKNLVNMMGGQLGVDSAVGKGSVFWVELEQA